jgi:bifunctional non-homologous end joining protein LigD
VGWNTLYFLFSQDKSILKLQSRNGIDITHSYPELIESLKQDIKCNESVIVDGEIVVLNKGFKSIVEVAFYLKELFDELKIISNVKNSGKTGLHIFVPVIRAYSYGQTKAFAEIVGRILSKQIPQKITTVWDTSQRSGKVFFDYNQNAKGKTIASLFSARPSVSATVSMPINWEELENIIPSDFTISTVPDILKRHADPWKDILEKGQDLVKIL